MPESPLDIERPEELLDYLRTTGRIAKTQLPAMTVLKGGVSNRTVLVERSDGPAWVLKQALPKLRTTADWFSDPSRIEREAAGITWLSKAAPPGSIPPLCFTDFAHHLLCMEAVPRPHENWKTMLISGAVDAAHVMQFGKLLGIIHRRGYERSRETACLFDDRSFFESLRVEPYYQYTAGRVTAAAPFLTDLVERTRRTRLTVVHGDYSPKNVLLRQGQLVLLDHEVIHFGDPAFDVGFAMAHLLSKAHHLSDQRTTFANAAVTFWQEYRDEVRCVPPIRELEPAFVRHSIGCLLARVAGRSPLEYLRVEERERQRDVAVRLAVAPPATIELLVDGFIKRIDQCRSSSA